MSALTPTQGAKVRLGLPDISRRLKTALSTLSEVDVVVGVATGGTVLASLAAVQLGLPLKLMHLNYRAQNNVPQRSRLYSSPSRC